MSPRPTRLRKISNPPVISGFKPYGIKKNTENNESIFLYLEEYEALRLCDFEMLNHQQASVLMAVSRPTLTRIYSRARQKIAEGIVMGKQIIIEGGKIYFDSEWFSCKNCGCYFNNPEKDQPVTKCPLCNSKHYVNFDNNINESDEHYLRCNEFCICPACSYEHPHQFGRPCKDHNCPRCGNRMVRKGTPPDINI